MDKTIELEIKILKFLKLKGTMEIVDIAYELEMPFETVKEAVHGMNATGEVVKVGYDTYQDHYKITDLGLDMIND